MEKAYRDPSRGMAMEEETYATADGGGVYAIDTCISNVLYSGPEVNHETIRQPRGVGTSS